MNTDVIILLLAGYPAGFYQKEQKYTCSKSPVSRSGYTVFLSWQPGTGLHLPVQPPEKDTGFHLPAYSNAGRDLGES